MAAIRIILLCIAAAALGVTLRAQRPEMAIGVTMAAGVLALMMSLEDMRTAVDAFSSMAQQAGVVSSSTAVMLRAAGIALLAEFGAQLCKDAGEGTIAGRIEFGARIAILAMSVPLFTGVVGQLSGLFQ